MKSKTSAAFMIATCGLTMATFADHPTGSGTQAAQPVFGLPDFPTLPLGGDFEVGNPANPSNPFGWSNNNDFTEAQWVSSAGLPSPPPGAPALSAKVISIGPMPAASFRSFNTDSLNFFQQGVDPMTGDGYIPYFDPTINYDAGDITISGWYLIKSTEAITASAPAGIKLNLKGAGNGFQDNAAYDPWGHGAPLITGHTSNQWRQFSFTWPIADIRAEVEANVTAGYFDLSKKPDRLKIVIGRFNGTAGTGAGKIYWDNISLSQDVGTPAGCNPADICGSGATYDNGTVDIGPDQQLSIDDFLVFLSAFSDATGCPGTAPCNPADICGSGATYDNGTVDIGPDGDLSIDDFLVFLSAFSDATGCP